MIFDFSTLTRLILSSALLILGGAKLSAEPTQSTRAQTIVFLGDSLTAGYGIDPNETYPALLQEKIDALGWNFRTINAGVSGETSAGGLRRINWLLRQPVDIFVLELGANDGLRGLPLTATLKNLNGIFARVTEKYPQAHLVIAGMQMPPNMGATYAKEFAAIYPELAKKNDALLIPFLLKDVGGHRDLNLPDGVHPTAEGHKIITETVWKNLQPLLQKLQADRHP